MKKLLLAGVAVFGLTIGTAQAGLLTLTGGSFGDIPGAQPANGPNEALPLFGIPATGSGFGFYGAQVAGTPGATYTYEIIGAEAGYLNGFKVDGTTIYTHPGGTVFVASLLGPALATLANSSSLGFAFDINSTGTLVSNGSNPDNTLPGTGPNFFASFDLVGSTDNAASRTGDVLYIFLDDGNTVDDNHDDLVVRITAHLAPVPEPATLGLLGAGLLGLGMAARRRRKV